eukprot:TRINITY_DN3990_c0_g1_i2.p1 TRINITY_DN3990_c0_g1~~TRINITY_DN3990_c0_g1_i2.p1  ORF type:complete len:315 (-),score=61.71 TRINITY_DN3990_c0_g1_i2:22-966(-)
MCIRDRSYIKNNDLQYKITCKTDVQAMYVSYVDTMWVGQLDENADEELWHIAATEVAWGSSEIRDHQSHVVNLMEDVRDHKSTIVHCIGHENEMIAAPQGGILLAGQVEFSSPRGPVVADGVSVLPAGPWTMHDGAVVCVVDHSEAQAKKQRKLLRHKGRTSCVGHKRAVAELVTSPAGPSKPNSPALSGRALGDFCPSPPVRPSSMADTTPPPTPTASGMLSNRGLDSDETSPDFTPQLAARSAEAEDPELLDLEACEPDVALSPCSISIDTSRPTIHPARVTVELNSAASSVRNTPVTSAESAELDASVLSL